MKMLMSGLVIALGVMAGSVNADQVINVDGEDYFLSHLTANCQSITDDPAGQVACFAAISALLVEQTDQEPVDTVSVAEKLDALKAVAQYATDETGLLIGGAECNVHFLYYANYFHISRRNVSTIDLISAQFDLSNVQFDATSQGYSAQKLTTTAYMGPDGMAAVRGGLALDSSANNFTPRSARTALDVYANEVAAELPATQAPVFDFLLVHPQMSDSSAEIWAAFGELVDVCNG